MTRNRFPHFHRADDGFAFPPKTKTEKPKKGARHGASPISPLQAHSSIRKCFLTDGWVYRLLAVWIGNDRERYSRIGGIERQDCL
jgi:hypothetical protein